MHCSLLLALVSLAVAVAAKPIGSELAQVPFNDLVMDYPGFQLDLNEKRLVQFDNEEVPVWLTELDKINAKAQGRKFFDITETQELGTLAHLRVQSTPVYPSLNATEQVKSVIKTLSSEGPKANLEKFTSFRTRHYKSDTGKESQKWLLAKIAELTEQNASKSLKKLISYAEFPHTWIQSSIIVRINASSAIDERVVILGAHQDSTNSWPFLPAPGADDDGSGTVTILEAYRALLAADFRPSTSHVELHFYSAEEGGLLGSQAIAKSYEAKGVNVYAMSQYDMTAWVKAGVREEVGVITDFVDVPLTKFNMALIDAYLDIPYAETLCGYACSDHASWSKAGYPGIFTIESQFSNSNKHIHSSSDRINISEEFSFSHMLEFSKLAVAFAIELAGWKQ